VVPADVAEAERAQHAHAAEPQDRLLAAPVAGVAAVEVAGEPSVLGGVRGEVGVEQEDGDLEAARSADVVTPGAHLDLAILDAHRDRRSRRFEARLRLPGRRQVALVAARVEHLAHVACSVDEREPHHRQLEVGGCAQRVARQHPEPAAVRGHVRLEPDVHREDWPRGPSSRSSARRSAAVSLSRGEAVLHTTMNARHKHP